MLLRPGGSRRDQVVLRRSSLDEDRLTLDNAQTYLTSAPSGGGIVIEGGGGAYSVAAAGQVTAVSGSTVTVSCEAPISKVVSAQNYTGKVLSVNDLVFVTGIIDGSTETYSVVSVYQGTGIPDFAIPPGGNPAFPRPMTEYTGTEYFTAGDYGMVVCRLNDTYPQVMITRSRSGSTGTSASSTLVWWDTVTTARGTITTPLFTDKLESVYNSSPILWPYGEGFAVFNGRARSAYTDTAIYAWDPRAGGGVGQLVTIDLPAETGHVMRAGGVGVDGKLWAATLTLASDFGTATPGAGGAGPSELKLYRFDTVAGNIYSGSWTLVSTTSMPNYVGGTTSSGSSIQYGLAVTPGGHLLAWGYVQTTTISNHVGATARLSGSSPTVNTYTQLRGLNSQVASGRFIMNDDSVLAVVGGSLNGFVVFSLYDPSGGSTLVTTGIPYISGSAPPMAVFDQAGNIMISVVVSDAGGGGVALYRSSKDGFSTLVVSPGRSASSTGFSSTRINSTTIINAAFGSVRAASGVNPKFVSLIPNGTADISLAFSFTMSAAEKSKYSYYMFEL